ncbi:hypothetical protein CRE_01426 [Caenorhabditis remanei]|uniref:Uncharacterized protein n=1 Tax=Caenorhabditis remanei TaxID=31234 RepID=E3NKZ3_CAERE|nr:hypothetical protein CRE_01426 [Caenorhabditis remanei]
MRLGDGSARTEGMRTMFTKSENLLREVFARVVTRTAPDQRLLAVYCSMRLGDGSARTEGMRTMFTKSENLLREVFARVVTRTAPDQRLLAVYCSMRLGDGSARTEGMRTMFTKSENLLREVFARVVTRTAPDQRLLAVYCSMRLGDGSARTEGMRTMFTKSENLLREVFARVVTRTAPDQRLLAVYCSMRLGDGSARTEGMRTMFTKSENLLREVFARVVTRTAPDQRLLAVYCSMRLGDGSARTIRDDYIHSALRLLIPLLCYSPVCEVENLTVTNTEPVIDDALFSKSEDRHFFLRIHACLGASPLGRTSKTQEFDGQLGALELVCAKATFPLDSEKPRNYSSKMSSWYGQTAPNTSDSLEYYLRFGLDTLFFILNYMALELNFLLQKPSSNYLGSSTLNIGRGSNDTRSKNKPLTVESLTVTNNYRVEMENR